MLTGVIDWLSPDAMRTNLAEGRQHWATCAQDTLALAFSVDPFGF
jgi:hypothetical protein